MLLAGSDGLSSSAARPTARAGEHGLEVDVRQDRRSEKWVASSPTSCSLPVSRRRRRRSSATSSGSTAERRPTDSDGDGPARRVRDRGDQATTARQRFGVAGGPIEPARAADERERVRRQRQPLRWSAAATARRRSRALLGRARRATGNIPEWKHLAVSDLPARTATPAGARRSSSGPNAIIIGGTTTNGRRARAPPGRTSRPPAPFFQLGLFGATVPALKIDGEIGQQLGYLSANTVGIINFVILVLIGWAFAHRAQVRAWRDRRRREKERGRR